MTDGMLAQGDREYLFLDSLKTNDPSVEVKYEKYKYGGVDYYIYLHGKCEGALSFHPEHSTYLSSHYGDKLITPHSDVSGKLRGKGYASFIYSLYLERGYVFVSKQQSIDSALLWDRLAKRRGRVEFATPTHEGLKVTSRLPKDNSKTWKVLLWD